MSSTNEAQAKRARKKRKLTPEQRQRILRERRRRALMKRIRAACIGLVALIVALVALIAVFQSKLKQEKPPVIPASNSEVSIADASERHTLELPTEAPKPKATPKPTQAPTPSPTEVPPTPEPTAVPEATLPAVVDQRIVIPLATFNPAGAFSYEDAYVAAVQGADTGAPIAPDYSSVDPDKLDRWPAVEEGFMPSLSRANTDENIIAVTVDDCFQGENLRKIVDCALANGARLTIFPIGENLEKPSVSEVVRYAWQQGMEIENHTYSHKGTYHYDDNAMADDIWKQGYLLNQALGVNYKEHFYRPKGGDERFDQRSHAYIQQLGFSAMALWTQSGSVDPMNSLLSNLGPGRIYLFHTTDNDLNKLLKFIPAAVKKGYRLVTLNEMFGLPANETSDLSTAPVAKPQLAAFRVQPMSLKATAYARAAAVVQKRLLDLGWMEGETTGVYGKTTHACVALFQAAAGLEIDGEAGLETQRLLFSDDAPIGNEHRIRELAQQMSGSVQDAIREMLNTYS